MTSVKRANNQVCDRIGCESQKKYGEACCFQHAKDISTDKSLSKQHQFMMIERAKNAIQSMKEADKYGHNRIIYSKAHDIDALKLFKKEVIRLKVAPIEQKNDIFKNDISILLNEILSDQESGRQKYGIAMKYVATLCKNEPQCMFLVDIFDENNHSVYV